MNFSRRELAALLPALAAAQSAEESKQSNSLPGMVYHSSQIPYKGDDTKKSRRFFDGVDHSGFHLEMHETILGPGTQSHPPHKHVHEEIMIVFEGTVETYMDGKTDRAEAGSVIYMSSNHMHNARNPGSVPCRYYVLELRGHEA